MSIFSDLKPFDKNSRNVFDGSYTDTFSSKVGMMSPVFQLHTVPDSKYKIDVGAILRTAPMQKANFTTIKANMDFFFVPYRQLWSSFPAFYYGRNDKTINYNNNAGNLNNTIPTGVPTFRYRDVASRLVENAVMQCLFNKIEESYKLLYKAGKFSTFKFTFAEQGEDDVVYTGLDAYSTVMDRLDKIKEDLFGKSFGSQASLSIPTYRDIHGRICAIDMIRNFDLLGYGNLWPIVKTYVAAHESFFDSYVLPKLTEGELYAYQATGSTQTAANNFPCLLAAIFCTAYRTAKGITVNNMSGFVSTYSDNFVTYVDSCFGFNWGDSVPIQSILAMDYFPNALSIQAAFKVWCDYYRQGQYDNIDYSYLYNFDYYTSGNGHQVISYQKVLNMLVPNYHLYKRDIFTGGYPNAQFGDVAVAGLQPEYSTMMMSDDDGNESTVHIKNVSGYLLTTPDDLTSSAIGQDLKIKNTGVVSALAVRQAMAIQRWKETILRCGNRERDLLEGMFGVHSKYIQDKYVDYVASFGGTINVNPVASTTENDNASLGELGAYAVGTLQGKEFDFSTNEFGVLIGVMYIMPEVKYDAFGFYPHNMKSEQNDFYNPKFQNLGLAPLTSLTYNLFALQYDDDSNVLPPSVLNYLSRYWEYKTEISHVHGDFYNTSPVYDEVVAAGGSEHPVKGFLAAQRGSKSPMVSVRDCHALTSAVLQSLYIAPDAIDTLFYANEDGTYSTDQFDIEMSFQVKAILPMSVEGLPNS